MVASAPTIDRPARERLAADLRRFLAGECDLFNISSADPPRSADSAVREVRWQILGLLDGNVCVVADVDRELWDALQRVLLVLDSDARLVHARTRRRSWTQAAAAGGLVLTAGSIGTALFLFGLHWALLAAFAPGTLFAWAVHRLNLNVRQRINARERRRTLPMPYGPIWPFATFAELETTLRSVPDFRKRRFAPRPDGPELDDGRADRFWNGCLLTISSPWLLVVSPLVLLWQCFPATETRTSVRPAD